MTRGEANVTIEYLKGMQEDYIEGEGYERHPLPEWYALDKAIEAMEKEPCEDAISRQAAIDSLGECPMVWTDSDAEITAERDWKDTVKMLKSLPSVMPQPKIGNWIEYSWNDNGLARWGLECDKCHKKYKYGGEIWGNPNYCPNCGVKMEVKE